MVQQVRVVSLLHAADDSEAPVPHSRRRRFASARLTTFLLAATFATIGSSALAAGPAPVSLGKAKFFVILSETGITDVSPSPVVGNVGTSPITGAADLLTCSEVTGHVFSVDAAGPAPCSKAKAAVLGKAVGAMQAAYTDAAGRVPDFNDIGGGAIGGLTLTPGTYKWTSDVAITSNVTLSGKAKDVWIFQVSNDVDLASATSILLTGGAKAKNIFWQVAGQVIMGTGSHFEGTILSATQIVMQTGASINGSLYAQTAVSLEMNSVNKSR